MLGTPRSGARLPRSGEADLVPAIPRTRLGQMRHKHGKALRVLRGEKRRFKTSRPSSKNSLLPVDGSVVCHRRFGMIDCYMLKQSCRTSLQQRTPGSAGPGYSHRSYNAFGAYAFYEYRTEISSQEGMHHVASVNTLIAWAALQERQLKRKQNTMSCLEVISLMPCSLVLPGFQPRGVQNKRTSCTPPPLAPCESLPKPPGGAEIRSSGGSRQWPRVGPAPAAEAARANIHFHLHGRTHYSRRHGLVPSASPGLGVDTGSASSRARLLRTRVITRAIHVQAL